MALRFSTYLFQDYKRSGYHRNIDIGIPLGYPDKLPPFQVGIDAAGSLVSVQLVRVDAQGNICETIVLDTGLLMHDTDNDIVLSDGNTFFSDMDDLEDGYYYVVINDGVNNYYSEPFKVSSTAAATDDGNYIITDDDGTLVDLGDSLLIYK